MAKEDEDLDINGSDGIVLDELSDEEKAQLQKEEADAWTPPTQAEYQKLVRESKRAAKDLEKYKTQATNAKSDDDVEAATTKVREETEAKYKSRVVRAEARALLTAAGAKGDLSVLVRMIDLDDVDVDDDGEIDGLDSQIEDLQTKVPDLFSTKVKADPRTRGDAGDKGQPAKVESPMEKMARLMKTGKNS